MGARLLTFALAVAVAAGIHAEDAQVKTARSFVNAHRHGQACLEAFEEAEGIIGGYDSFEKHKETAETMAQKLAEVTGRGTGALQNAIYERLKKASTDAIPPQDPETLHEKKQIQRKIRSPLHAMELCEFALKHHDEL
ncbi:unnamed protein product [Prorocentrum cordatum]|uniref:Uncharacterized protein n=1 Tax=Prorocentrum cordatum TaxID=2364126 RepID=A0ABN9WTX2_9DINO|nr:unnamed protein product [Polarella glacialis]